MVDHKRSQDEPTGRTARESAQAELTLEETPRGVLALPHEIFQRIVHQLPACLQRADDDAPPAWQYPRLPLLRTVGERSYLLTRNTAEIARLLCESGMSVQIRSVCFFNAHVKPASLKTSLLALTKKARTDVIHLDDDHWARVEHFRYAQFLAVDEQQKFSLAALLCAAFRDAPVIVFIVASAEEVERVAAELSVRLQEPVQRAYGNRVIAEARIVVATYVAARGPGLGEAPFLIMPCWRPGLPQWMKDVIWRAYADRIYLLHTQAENLSAAEQDGWFGRLGPVIVEPPRSPAPVHTFSLLLFGGPGALRHRGRQAKQDRQLDQRDRPVAGHPADRLNKQNLYWRHPRRNQALAALAEALAADGNPVTVLVEVLDHAHHLGPMLAGWPVIQETAIPAELPTNAIVTLSAAASWQEFQPTRLIWAAGGPPSDWLAGWLERMTTIGRAVRVIDVGDAFALEALRLAGARQRAYRTVGCHWRPLPNAVVRQCGRSLRATSRSATQRRPAGNQTRR